jgi:hypothetical protein
VKVEETGEMQGEGHQHQPVLITDDPNLPVEAYLSLLKPTGHLIFVGLPNGGYLPKFSFWPMVTSESQHLQSSSLHLTPRFPLAISFPCPFPLSFFGCLL